MPPKIERVETYSLWVPLRRPVADSIYYRTHWHVPVVEIFTDEGLVGTGYSGLWAGEDLLCKTIESYIGPMLLGRDPREIHRLWAEIYWSPLHWVGRAGVAHMALSMVDVALWDLAAQRAEQPLWRLLGGRHPQLKTYNTDGGWLNFDLETLISDMGTMVAAGWDRVKMKVGGADPEVDLYRATEVRRALGPNVTLMVDVNQKWDRITAELMGPRLAELNIGWIEEPLHPDDIIGHAALAKKCPIPIALGENVYNLETFAAFIDMNAVDIVQPDVTRVGGVTEWLRIAHLAQGQARWVVPHAGDMCQVHQHLAGAISADRPALIEYLPWALEIFEQPIQVERGILTLPDTPGASSRIRPEAKHAFSRGRSGFFADSPAMESAEHASAHAAAISHRLPGAETAASRADRSN
jgi:L-alanine-DL-glutamate epimerase-like enolase superfamily enzyme